MKFKIKVQLGDDPENTHWETHNAVTNNPHALAMSWIESYNASLRGGELPRKLIETVVEEASLEEEISHNTIDYSESLSIYKNPAPIGVMQEYIEQGTPELEIRSDKDKGDFRVQWTKYRNYGTNLQALDSTMVFRATRKDIEELRNILQQALDEN